MQGSVSVSFILLHLGWYFESVSVSPESMLSFLKIFPSFAIRLFSISTQFLAHQYTGGPPRPGPAKALSRPPASISATCTGMGHDGNHIDGERFTARYM